METGWLLEVCNADGSVKPVPQYVFVDPQTKKVAYTIDSVKALRFAREVDATAFSSMFNLQILGIKPTEHSWG